LTIDARIPPNQAGLADLGLLITIRQRMTCGEDPAGRDEISRPECAALVVDRHTCADDAGLLHDYPSLPRADGAD
jgi:hypothetical protein